MKRPSPDAIMNYLTTVALLMSLAQVIKGSEDIAHGIISGAILAASAAVRGAQVERNSGVYAKFMTDMTKTKEEDL